MVKLTGLLVPVEIDTVIKDDVATNSVNATVILRNASNAMKPAPKAPMKSKSQVGIIELSDRMDLMIGTPTKALITITLVMMIYRSQFVLIGTSDLRFITKTYTHKLPDLSRFR